jgi:hypothetical protein
MTSTLSPERLVLNGLFGEAIVFPKLIVRYLF